MVLRATQLQSPPLLPARVALCQRLLDVRCTAEAPLDLSSCLNWAKYAAAAPVQVHLVKVALATRGRGVAITVAPWAGSKSSMPSSRNFSCGMSSPLPNLKACASGASGEARVIAVRLSVLQLPETVFPGPPCLAQPQSDRLTQLDQQRVHLEWPLWQPQSRSWFDLDSHPTGPCTLARH